MVKVFLGAWLASALVAAAALVTLQPNETGELQCSGDELRIEQQTITSALYNCLVYTPVPTPTPSAPYAGAPLCATHDATAYHTLWNEAQGCHYDHEHKGNPHDVDDVLGTDYYTWAGGEISYPWQTHAGGGAHHSQPEAGKLENELKHSGYNWIVRENMPCVPAAGATGCITDFRLQAHIVFSPVDAVVRFHSYWVEARVCLPSDLTNCGIIRTGGWMDYGRLSVTTRQPNGQFTNVWVPLPGDPPVTDSTRRLHPGNSDAAQNPLTTASESFWYGTRRITEGMTPPALFHTVHIAQGDIWQNIDAVNPSITNLYCYSCEFNGSTIQMHQLGFRVDQMLKPVYDADGNGRIDFNGYTDRFGRVAQGCTAAGLDCVPFVMENVPIAGYSYRDDGHGIGVSTYDYDISPAGESWITYPY